MKFLSKTAVTAGGLLLSPTFLLSGPAVNVSAQSAAGTLLHMFPLAQISPYINAPVYNADGTVILHNNNPRPSGSQAYVTGAGSTAMPTGYSPGDVLQWAVRGRALNRPSATLNLGVQSGGGDENNLSVRGGLNFSGEDGWVLSPPVTVNNFKPVVYFYIPGGDFGQAIQIQEIVVGDPASVLAHVASSSCAAPPAGLAGWWPGDDNADDLVNANDGSPTDGAAFAPGKVGGFQLRRRQ